MKIIRKYYNGFVDIIPETEKDNTYEKGDYIEVDFTDYKIMDYEVRDGLNIYQAQKV